MKYRSKGQKDRNRHKNRSKGVGKLVSWCFESSQPERITSGLKTNFNQPPTPTYPFHKLLYHKSLFLKPQLKFYSQFWNANPDKQQHMFWSLMFSEHSSSGTCTQQGDTFYSAGLHRNRCQPLIQEKLERIWKNAGEWTRRVEIN